MTSKHILLLAVAALLAAGKADAATYIWTGADGANDATWENPLNWDGGIVPNGVAGQLSTSSSSDVVTFDSETAAFMPSNSITTRNSFTGSFKNPQIQVLNGQVNFTNGLNWGWNGTTMIVGDGDMTTLAIANTGFTELNRDPNGLKTYTVIADFGGQLPDLATIEAQFGNSFRLGGSLAGNPDAELMATDNGNGTFNITVIPEPRAALLGGIGLLMLLRRRR